MFRTNLVLAIVAVILAIPTAWTLYGDRTVFRDQEDVPRLFPGFTRENVRAVVISKPKYAADGSVERDEKGEVVRDALQLVRSADEWRVANGPLQGVVVRGAQVYERVLRHLESIEKDEQALVREAASPEELERYGLGAEEATLVQAVGQTAPLAELYVGDDASRGEAGEDVVRGFFVRSKDDTDVVLYEQPYWVLDVDPAQWYDRNPLRFPVDQVVEVRLHNNHGEFAFERESAQQAEWQVTQAAGEVGAVRQSQVRAFVQSLSMLDVQRYLERLPAAGPEREAALAVRNLAEPEFFAEVKLADGARHRIAIGSQVENHNERYLAISSVDFLMAVGEWVLARFEKDPRNEFFDPPASRVPAETGEKDK